MERAREYYLLSKKMIIYIFYKRKQKHKGGCFAYDISFPSLVS